MSAPQRLTLNESLACEIEPILKRAGWTLSVGAIAAVLDAWEAHHLARQRDDDPASLTAGERYPDDRPLNKAAVLATEEAIRRADCTLRRERLREAAADLGVLPTERPISRTHSALELLREFYNCDGQASEEIFDAARKLLFNEDGSRPADEHGGKP